MKHSIGTRHGALLLLVVGLLSACVPPFVERPVEPRGTVSPGSQLIGCDQADQRVVVTSDAHLDPACVYRAGFDITASDVEFDCRGARVEDVDRTLRIGILVTAPADVPLSHIRVRNCVVKGFNNNMRVTREGFKQLARGAEYENGFQDIVLENNHLYSSRGSGIFVDGYVTGVTMRDMDIAGSGGVGIYLEAGSKGSTVEGNHLHRNGFAGTGPEGTVFDLGGGTLVRYQSTGREGLAIDGSSDNRVVGNRFEDNANGAILVYKNCGEYVTLRPQSWWTRPYGADRNLIEGNVISREDQGVWVGSRMSENQLVMDCSDPAYVDGPGQRIHEDQADGNFVRDNDFHDVRWGVRVEDDATLVVDNRFTAGDPAGASVLIGTEYRTTELDRPVAGTRVTGNHTDSGGPLHPYVWVHGHVDTDFRDNSIDATTATLDPGVQPPRSPFLMVVRFL